MPAPKGIPIPEAKAFRLDERIYAPRQAKERMASDERLQATNHRGVQFAIRPSTAERDEGPGAMVNTQQYHADQMRARGVRDYTEHTMLHAHTTTKSQSS